MLDNSQAQITEKREEPGYIFLTYDNGNSAIIRDDGTVYSEEDKNGNEWHYKKDGKSIDYTVEKSENGTLSYFDEHHVLCFEKKTDALVSYYEGTRNYEVDAQGNTTYFRGDGQTVFCQVHTDKTEVFFRSDNTKACESVDDEQGFRVLFYKDDGKTIDHIGKGLAGVSYYTQDGKEDFVIKEGYATCMDGDKKTDVHFDRYGWFNRFRDTGYKSEDGSFYRDIEIGNERWHYNHNNELENWTTRDREYRDYEKGKLKERRVGGHTLVYDRDGQTLVSDSVSNLKRRETVYYQSDGQTLKSKEVIHYEMRTYEKLDNGITGRYSSTEYFDYKDGQFVLDHIEMHGTNGENGRDYAKISAATYYQDNGEKLLKEVITRESNGYLKAIEKHYREDGETLLKSVKVDRWGKEETYYREDGVTVDYIKNPSGEKHYDETGQQVIWTQDANGNKTFLQETKEKNQTKVDYILKADGVRTDRDGIPDNGLAEARRKVAKIFGLQDIPTSKRYRSGEAEVSKRFAMAQRWARQVLSGTDKSDA